MGAIQVFPFIAMLSVVKELAIVVFLITASVAAVALARWLNRQ